MNGSGPLHFDSLIRDVNFTTTIDRMERQIIGVTNTATRETNKLDSQFARLGQLAAGYFSFTALAQLPAHIVKVRQEFESLEIAFGTMLRSKVKADQLLSEVRDFAATTPFGLKETATGAKQLLAYGFAAKDLIPTLKRLGDVSAGLGLPLERLTYLYGTTKTQGRLFAQDLNQFVGSGIPLIDALAKQFGVAEDKVRDLVEEGKVGFDEVKKAIEGMTSGSGIFAGALDAQSKSLAGIRERLGDAWDTMLNEIGKQNQDLIASVITSTTEAVEHYQQFIDVLTVVAAGYGAYRAALLLNSVAQIKDIALTEAQAIAKAEAANATGFLTISQTKAAAATALTTRAQAMLNATMLANPIALVATAIGALVAAYFVFRKEVKDVKSAQELLAESSNDVSTNFGKQKGEINTLIGIIKNQNVAESERKKAYDKLNAITPEILRGLDFEKAKIQDLKKATDDYLVSLKRRIEIERGEGGTKKAYDQDAEAAERLAKAEEDYLKKVKAAKAAANQSSNDPLYSGGAAYGSVALIQAKQELEAAQAYKKQTEKVVQDAEAFLNKAITGAASKEALQANIQKQESLMATLGKLDPLYKQAEDRLVGYRQELQKIEQAEKAQQTVKAKTVEQLESEIKAQKDLQAQQSSKAGYDKIQKEIDALDKQRRRITGELTAEEKKAAQKAQKEADKSGPYGSVDYWTAIEKKVEDILSKTPATDKAKIAQQQAILLNAQRKAEEARKAITVKSFDEELSDKKSRYELYQKWVDAYGKQAADTQFSDLIKSGQSYVDYLNNQIAQLENDKENVGLTDKDAANLSKLLDERNEATGKKSAIDVFRESLQQAGRDAQSLTDYLEVLRQKQAELDSDGNSPNAIGKRTIVAQQIVETENARKAQLREYLSNLANAEGQQVAIQKRYADLRAALETQFNGQRTAEYNKALASINQDEKEELEAFQRNQFEKSEAYKELTKTILEEGRKALKIQIERQKRATQEAKQMYGSDSEVYLQEQKKLNDLQNSLNSDTLSTINAYGQLVQELAEAYVQLGGAVGDAGMVIAGFSANISLVTQAFKENMSAAEGMQLVLQATVNIISSITNATAQRRKAEEDFYRNAIAYQRDYNLALNEQTGTRAEKNESIFYKDFEARLKDRAAQLVDAQKGYMASLKALDDAQVKIGQYNKVNWGTVGKNVASGAAAGFALGGPLGAIVGGVGGFVAGLFGAKEKADELGSLLKTYPDLIKDAGNGQLEFNTVLAQALIDNNQLDESSKALVQNTIDWTKKMEEARAQIKSVIQDLAGGLGDQLRNNLVNAFVEGTSAAESFGNAVSDIIANLVSQMLFTKVLGPSLKKLEDEMTASATDGGDGDFIDDITRFYQKAQAEKLAEVYTAGLEAIDKYGEQLGLDIFKQASKDLGNPNTLKGNFQGMTENTAGVLIGQFNAIRMTTVDTNIQIRQQLFHIANIDRNTSYLVSIDKKLDALQSTQSSDPLRAKGL